MNLKTKRKKYLKDSLGGLICCVCMGIMGLYFLYNSSFFSVTNFEMLYYCIYNDGFAVICGLFFLIISVIAITWVLLNYFTPPKKEMVYLKKIDGKTATFINKKGRSIIYDIENEILEEKSNYYVMKSYDHIYLILEKLTDKNEIKERKSYWLNLYLPQGGFENMLLLPILYLFLVIGLIAMMFSHNIYYIILIFLLFTSVPLFFIVYDLIYKIKLRKSGEEKLNVVNLEKSIDIFKNVISIVFVSILVAILLFIFIYISDPFFKFIFSPFVCCGICIFGETIFEVFDNDFMVKVFKKTQILITLLYIFCILLIWTIGICYQNGNLIYSLFSLPFWILLMYAFYKYFIKKKK